MKIAIPVEALVDELNDHQKEAVEAPDGPLLIFAGAGSGKTKVLTHKIAYMLATGKAEPYQICAVTFTNKAAREMKERLEKLVGFEPMGMWLGTFHALGSKLLREHSAEIGRKNGFTIFDDGDSTRVLREAINDSGVDLGDLSMAQMIEICRTYISYAKDQLDSPADCIRKATAANNIPEINGAKVYELYERKLLAANGVDFDDLIKLPVDMFQNFPHILDKYREQYKYLLVDEYQDTSRAQYSLVTQLASHHRNITVVGDDSQCLTAETQVLTTNNASIPISGLKPGISLWANDGKGRLKERVVQKVDRYSKKSERIIVTTQSGKTLTSTPEHTHFARYILNESPQKHILYLMYKRNFGYRIGVSQIYSKFSQQKQMISFEKKCLSEMADALWVLEAHDTSEAAHQREKKFAAQYNIPTLNFYARPYKKKNLTNSISQNQELINAHYTENDSKQAAQKLMEDFGLFEEYPYHIPEGRNSTRHNAIITLCGDVREHSSLHHISLIGNDKVLAEKLKMLGFSIRPAKKGSSSWRYETSFADFNDIQEKINILKKNIPEVNVRFQARLADRKNAVDGTLLMLPASSVREGMMMLNGNGDYEVVKKVERVYTEGDIYDVDVERTHNFIANGLVTHNSIYGWRGADIRNILSFSKDYPDAKTITLDQNYRSTQIILDAAYGVIQHNKVRVDKKLWSEVKEGEPIYLLLAENDIHEALIVSDEIQKLVDKGHSYKDFAILYRTNAQSRAFEDVFVRRQIPYKVAGGLKFYARKEIKDSLAYLQLLANPSNVMAFKRIMDVTEGIGRKTAAVVEAQSYEKEISIVEAAQRDDVILKIPKAARGPLKKFADMMTRHAERAEHESLGEIFESLMEESGYRERLVNLPAHEHEKLENLDTLVGLAKEGYDDVQPPNGLFQFLENAALISSTDEVESTNEDAVTLITMHQSKGLEYLIVFISGMEEKIFPLWRTLEEDPSAAEERRLAYVAITRAQRRLYVNYSRQRNLYGQTKDYKPSRFFNEIPKHLMKRLPSLSLVRYLQDEGRNRLAQKQKLMQLQAQAQTQAVTLEQEAKPVFET